MKMSYLEADYIAKQLLIVEHEHRPSEFDIDLEEPFLNIIGRTFGIGANETAGEVLIRLLERRLNEMYVQEGEPIPPTSVNARMVARIREERDAMVR